MTPTIDIIETPDLADPTMCLFQVWIDLNARFLGEGPPDWWWDSEPQPLQGAIDDAAKYRAIGWVCIVMPEGQNPRPDGRWDNP